MGIPGAVRICGLCIWGLASLHGAERDALAIENTLLQRHLPYGTVLNPIFAPGGATIVAYTRCGDSALFTGDYAAAEAFRYAVTRSLNALANLRNAIDALTRLTDITGTDVLSRCALPADSPYAGGISNEESANGVFRATVNGKTWVWIGHTSRDQYSGVFFGLGTAYDLTDDPGIRASIASLTTRLLNNLLQNGWSVVMPNGDVSTTFAIRPDQQLALLQIGRHVNPQAFSSKYSSTAGPLAISVPLPLGIEAADNHSSYFKFNLDFMNLYNLIRLEGASSAKGYYETAFTAVRVATSDHRNAFFNMVDRALHGPDAARDAETPADLDAWLRRPRTDLFVDWRGKVLTCGNEACAPLPVEKRPPSDFLWQLDPYQLFGGGSGSIETAGIDYLMPYWMARYYGVIEHPLPSAPPPRRGM